MTRAIGDEGIGYYNTAYEIYNIGLILSSYSLPLAISKLIAARRVHGKNQDVQRVFKAGLLFGLVAGGLDHGSYLQQPQQRPSTKGYGTHHSGLFHYGRGARLFPGTWQHGADLYFPGH